MTPDEACLATVKARKPKPGQPRPHFAGKPHVCAEPKGHAPDQPPHRCWCGHRWEDS